MNQIFDENKVIETERLIIRFISKNDYEDLYHNVFSDDDMLKYFLCEKCDDINRCKDYVERLTNSAINRKSYFFSIVLKETNEVIGLLLQCSTPDVYHNSCELGYAIAKKYWSKGYASEALKAGIDFMFEIGIYKVFATHIKENVASGKVMRKCGMKYEGSKENELYYHDKYWSIDEYCIFNEKFS